MALKRIILTILCFFLLIKGSRAQSFTVDTLINNGNKYNRINLVFMGEGYTAAQQTKFVNDVNGIVGRLFQTFPFSQYQQFFNVYAIHVISKDSGASHPVTAADCSSASPTVPEATVNNYFSTAFDYGGVHRLLYCNNTSAINNVLEANFPLYDKGLVVVNTPYYGGSGGEFPTCSANPSSSEIMIHELGHSFAGLGDEYGGSLCNGIEKPNVTQETDTALVKWKAWITKDEPIPTQNNTLCSTVGLYQGANYCNTEWYRPKCNCKMNMLGQPFCEICSESFIYNINNYISLIDDYSPLTSAITISTGQSQNFTGTFLLPTPNSLLVTWKADDSIVATNINNYTVASTDLTQGTHVVVLRVMDTTYHSKTAMPVYTKTWVITNNVTAKVLLNPLPAVCKSSLPVKLSEGSPVGGFYSGTAVTNGMFNPTVSGEGVFAINYTLSGITATQNITVNQACETSNTTGVNTVDNSATTINVYPNPSNGVFMVKAASKETNTAQVIITDIYGKEVSRTSYNLAQGELSQAINISTLPAGTYFVQVKKGDKVYNRKITKQ